MSVCACLVGNIIYHIDADELFVSHYDNFIILLGNEPLPRLFLCSAPAASPEASASIRLSPRSPSAFAASFALLLVSCVELLVKCL